MININGHKLTKSDLDEVFEVINYSSVLVQTDMLGFGYFIELYPGWVSPPAYSVDKAYMNGVHPSGIGVYIVGSKSWSGMQIFENVDTPSLIESIINYT